MGGAVADFRLDRLSPFDHPDPRFRRLWQVFCEKIEEAFDSLDERIEDIEAAQAAAVAANAAAVAANTAAANAQTTADNIEASAELADSYVSGATISATDAGSDATVSVSAHTRHYPQPDSTTDDVAVNAGSVTGLSYSTLYYIYYDDEDRSGGAVTYLATTSEATAAQIGDRHCVGAITTPAAAGADTGGAYTRPPGPGAINIA